MKTLRYLLVAALLASGFSIPAPATAVTARSSARQVSYVISYEPAFGLPHMPYVGWLQLKIDSSGIINGTYRGLSITPDDPFVNRITPVTGGVSGNTIHFDIGMGISPFSFNGQIQGNWIEGTAIWRGQIYRVTGEIGRPRGM